MIARHAEKVARSLPAKVFLACLLGVAATTARAQAPPTVPLAEAAGMVESPISKVDFEQKLNAKVPLDLKFVDETGKEVLLADYFGSRPVLMTLNYYRCPLICGQELNGLARSLKVVSGRYGKDFEVVTVSIAPDEKPPLAAAKKKAILEKYGRPGAAEGWHFLTGEADQIHALAEAVGFRYVYNPRKDQYIHSAGLLVLTPDGTISRYFYGMEYPSRDLEFSLIDASAGKVGSPVHKILLFCYDYDPTTGRYTLAVTYLVRVVGTLTALALASYVGLMVWRDRRRGPLTQRGPIVDLPEPRSV